MKRKHAPDSKIYSDDFGYYIRQDGFRLYGAKHPYTTGLFYHNWEWWMYIELPDGYKHQKQTCKRGWYPMREIARLMPEVEYDDEMRLV